MTPQLDTRPALAARVYALTPDHIRRVGGRKHVAERQLFLNSLVMRSLIRNHRHLADPSCDAFAQSFLARGLRCPRSYQKLLDPLYDFPMTNRGYDRERRLCKPYRLREEVRDAIRDVLRDEPPSALVVEETGEELRSLPSSGLPASLAHLAAVPGIIPADLLRVPQARAKVRRWMETLYWHHPLDEAKPEGTNLAEALDQLAALEATCSVAGGLPNLYSLQSHGRLGGKGLHVINLPRKLRELLFEDSGLADFDIASCFWSIFVSAGRSFGFATERAEDYVANKGAWHSRWASLVGTTEEWRVKQVAVSWLTGGQLSTHRSCSAARSVGSRGVEALLRDESTVALFQEVRRGLEVLLEASVTLRGGGTEVYVNAVGAELVDRPGDRKDDGQKCAHVLTGLEQFAMRAMLPHISGLVAVIYDGFIAEPQDVAPLQAIVRRRSEEELGWALDVRLKQSAFGPVPDLERDPADF